jgi:hypothetical protein
VIADHEAVLGEEREQLAIAVGDLHALRPRSPSRWPAGLRHAIMHVPMSLVARCFPPLGER